MKTILLEIFASLLLLAIVSGLLFGGWPPLMQRSGLSPLLSAAVFAGFTFVVVAVMVLFSGDMTTVHTANWGYAVAGGLVGGVALAIFTYMVSKTTPETFGPYFTICLMSQVLFAFTYHTVVNWEKNGPPSLRQIAGILGAFVVIWLLK